MDFSDISVATLNVNGMNSYNKRQGVHLWFRNHGLDLLCLQEVHVDSLQRASVWGAESPDVHCVWSPSTSRSAGVTEQMVPCPSCPPGHNGLVQGAPGHSRPANIVSPWP